MKNECVNGLQTLLADMKETAQDLPVLVGGIAVNKVTAYELSHQFGIPVYYGHDVNDAETILNKALSRGSVDIPTITSCPLRALRRVFRGRCQNVQL